MGIAYTRTLFLLLSLFIYVVNKTLEAKPATEIGTLGNAASKISITNPEEITKASELMDEVVTLLWHNSTNIDDYKLYHSEKNAILYFTKDVNPNVGKLSIRIRDSNKCNDVVTLLYNPNGPKYFDENFISTKKITQNETIIAYVPVNINDHNDPNMKNYQNTILENANSLKIDIYSEEDIRRGELKKWFNLFGYIIKK
ncbi:hypothetical protein PBSP11RLL_000017300 [Plasmodium berghei]|uniref:Fam-a protein n=1 Tax=Plasmodium berghei TaxID=5821 RepID=A0A1D3LT62_PLABE|nr:hypothetical protein PBSP11RLL_000017300 [Plasmodium berghei]